MNAIFEGRSRGVCVEVGVNDPKQFSNTYFFECLGWETVLVEANPETWERIEAARTAKLFRCGASDQSGSAQFLIVENAVGMSTLETARLAAASKSEGRFRAVTVPLRTLDAILNEAGLKSIDFLSVDVEGHEVQVLRGFSINSFQPRVILVERNQLRDKTVASYLRDSGYTRFLSTGCNDWYAQLADVAVFSRAKAAFRFPDAMIVWRERLRLVVIDLMPRRLVRFIRLLKHFGLWCLSRKQTATNPRSAA